MSYWEPSLSRTNNLFLTRAPLTVGILFLPLTHAMERSPLKGGLKAPTGLLQRLLRDTENVLAKSRQLILNPFAGHRVEDRMVTNHDIRENIKELAQLDGAFVIRGDGLIEAAARYITVDTSAVGIGKGLGTRHSSIAGITLVSKAVGIVVSQSGGKISIFRDGQMLQEIG